MMRTRYRGLTAYETVDGSLIRELMHPCAHGNQAQSLAEAVVAPGSETRLHRHSLSEEIYRVSEGHGQMRLGDETFAIVRGDTICIRPEAVHNVRNTSDGPLRILCACAPAYSHEDTGLV